MNKDDWIRSYQLKDEIGRGSYGDVWRAEKQMGFGGGRVHYALKFLRGKDESGVDIEKVIGEIAVWIKANAHANIISIRDAFIEQGKYVIVSDYADGGSLKGKSFPRETIFKIMDEVLSGIEFLHGVPIIHRDIKPENILLKNGIACIGDFGLARDFDKTQSTGLGGSMMYCSPEIIRNEIDNLDHERTPLDDLWATSVTFYQILTGEAPFRKMGDIAKCKREPLSPDFPAELTGFFERALHENREKRFQSAGEMRKALYEIVSAEAKFTRIIDDYQKRFQELQGQLEQTQRQAEKTNRNLLEEKRRGEELKAALGKLEEVSAADRKASQNLQEQIEALQSELRELRRTKDAVTAENEKLKAQQTAAGRIISPPAQTTGAENERLLPLPPENAEKSSDSAASNTESGGAERLLPRPLKQTENEDNRLLPRPPKTTGDGSSSSSASLDLAVSYYSRGEMALRRKDYNQAINHFTFIINLSPQDADAYHKRGIAYRQRAIKHRQTGPDYNFKEALANYDKALADFTRAIELDGNKAKFYYDRGLTHYQKLDYKETIADYKAVLDIDPDWTAARDGLKEAKRKRRGEIAFGFIGVIMVSIFVIGLIVPTYLLAHPLASFTTVFVKTEIYNFGPTGETIAFVVTAILYTLLFGGISGYLIYFIEEELLIEWLSVSMLVVVFIIGLFSVGYLAYAFFLMPNYYQSARECYEKKDYACAVENYTRTVRWYPRYWLTADNAAYLERGNAYLGSGSVDLAVRDFEKAVRLNPNDPQAVERLKIANQAGQKK